MAQLPWTKRRIMADLRAFVAASFRDGVPRGLRADTPLVTSGIVDSAGVAHLVDYIERRYGVRVEDAEVALENFNTLAALGELVVRKLAALSCP
jgi:acyl carrier protein